MTVYVDILILINFYIDYLIIKISLMILKRKVKTFRVLISVFFASLTSLIIFLPQNIVIELIFKFITAFIISLILRGFNEFIKLSFTLLIVASAFNGLFLLLGNTLFKTQIVTVNGCTYIDISLLTFGISTTVIYLILRFVGRFFATSSNENFTVKIINNNETVEFNGFSDSGNKLTDYLTGKPIIICPENDKTKELKTKRLIPYNTIDSNGLIKLVKVEKVEIEFENGKKVNVDALIGINEKQSNNIAITNPSVLK